MNFLDSSPGLDPDALVIAYCATQAALGQIPKNAFAFGFELMDDHSVRLIFEMREVTQEDRTDIDSISADLELGLLDLTPVSTEIVLRSSRAYDLGGRPVEWLWSIHDSLA